VLHSLARKERLHNHWHLGIVIRDARVVRSLSHEPARLTVESRPGPTYLQRPPEGSFGPSIPRQAAITRLSCLDNLRRAAIRARIDPPGRATGMWVARI
jgi:hypothetical protein